MPRINLCLSPGRGAAFVTVAAMGFAVQAAAILLLTSVAGLHLAAATAIAVVLAIGHNFVWHEHWTWADRDRSARVLTRLLRFGAATGAVSLVGTVVLTTAYDSLLKTPVVVSNLLAVWTVGFLNYLMLDRVIYQELK